MSKVAITNVRVFDDEKILPATTVVFEDGLITGIGNDHEIREGANIVDALNGVLLPGLIDAHVHLHGPESLQQLAQFGITSACDMATWPPSLVVTLRGAASKGGITDFKSPGIIACSPSSSHSRMPTFPSEELVTSPEDAVKFVQRRVDEGVDYIKVIADLPGLEQTTLNALVIEAKKQGKKTVAHAAQAVAFTRAIEANADILTHAPLDQVLDGSIVELMVAQQIIAVPTLTMMESVTNIWNRPGLSYVYAKESVTAMQKAGIPILAGTDANAEPGAPAKVKHGESMHHELGLLVGAGLSNLDALRAGTSLPAKYFGFGDRGVIAVGKRADLLLLREDPIDDIKATRTIQKVWCQGIEVKLE
ncbi:putative amidohydrolase [Acephala macrosclerotiorum]|nr:putative amidohydrolase [Acephala macrosclerotiorum]